MKDSNRIAWIDISKGLLISLIVLGHIISDSKNPFQTWIYSFHVPAFFLINGLLKCKFSFKKNRTFIDLLKKEKQLTIMYIAFSLIFFVRVVIQTLVGMYSIYEMKLFILHIITLNGEGVLWYIPVFLLAEIILFITLSKSKIRLILFALAYCVGIILYIHSGFENVLYEDNVVALLIILYIRVMIASSFMFIGYFLEHIGFFDSKFILLGVLSVGAIVNGNVDLNNLYFNNLVLYYAFGIFGALLIILASRIIEKSSYFVCKILSIWGKNSIIIMLTHAILLIYQFCTILFYDIGNINSVIYILISFLSTMTIETFIILFWDYIKRIRGDNHVKNKNRICKS